jgi:inner membrane protein
MDSHMQMLVCLGVGVGLIVAELALPGFVSIFLGLAALVVAGLLWGGWIEGWTSISIAWVAVSIFLIMTLRSTVMKFFPGDTSVGSMDEDGDASGSVVEVVKDIKAGSSEGQVLFRDAVWSARSVSGPIAKGKNARLVRRDNLVWIVEPET